MTCLIVGTGITGRSVSRFLKTQGVQHYITDTQPCLGGETDPRWMNAQAALNLFSDISLVAVSPGVRLDTPLVRKAYASGIPVVGDIELFARHNRAAVVGITGTNGKSTVTKMLTHVLNQAGIRAAAGGNIGTPALDLLELKETQVYVLELSSFQLETTFSLKAQAAAILNISPDHLDRHGSMKAYSELKAGLADMSEYVIAAYDIPISNASSRFALEPPENDGDYGFDAKTATLLRGKKALMQADEIPMIGLHSVANVLAVWGLARCFAITDDAIAAAVRSFRGLPHRCCQIALADGIRWIDDSKATNVSSTQAALSAFSGKKVVLIAGGQPKGQDFSSLKKHFERCVKALIVIGEAAEEIAQLLPDKAVFAPSMATAVERASREAVAGDTVLLSPACASFDMFGDYQHRGREFQHHARRHVPSQGLASGGVAFPDPT